MTEEIISDLDSNEGVTHSYTYDNVWKDKLIDYDGKSISYELLKAL